MLLRSRGFASVMVLTILPCWAGCGDDDDDDSHDHEPQAGSSAKPDGAAGESGGSARDAGGKPDAGTEHDAGTMQAVDAGSDAAPARRAVTIKFVPRVGIADFECGLDYPNQGSTQVTVTGTDFRFYVQDLRLIAADGSDVPVEVDERTPWQAEGVSLLDFEDATGACLGTPEMNDVIIGSVPRGEYRGVAFVNGVPETLNHGNPPELPAPLQAGGMQWSWLTGYRFLKAEVMEVLDDTMDGGAIAGIGYLHPGANGCRRDPDTGTIECSKPNRNEVRLDNFDPDGNAIAVDLGAMFAESDLTQDSQCHSASDECIPMFERLGIDFATGMPLSTQKVYHVE